MNYGLNDKTPKVYRWKLTTEANVFTVTRQGGYSQGEYGEMNINPWVGDDPEAVKKNQQLLCQALQLRDTTHLIIPHQVHGTKMLQITRDFFDLKPEAQAQRLEGIDIVMTDVPDVSIGVTTADCVPLVFYDQEHHAGCAVHAGWRGCAQNIIQKAILAMKGAYSTRPGELQVLIGPCIAKYNYHVKSDVMEQFRKAGFDPARFSLPVQYIRKGEEHVEPEAPTWELDLNNFCMGELRKAGVMHQRIFVSLEDTYGKADEYFSARRQGPNCGRIYTGIIL